MKKFFQKPNIVILITAFAVVVIAVVGLTQRDRQQNYEFVLAEKKDVVQEVSVTGQVRAAEEVALAFERGGKVGRVAAKVGDSVKAHQVLVILSNADLAAQVLQAEANLEAEQAKLSELQKGPRLEELQAVESKIINAAASLQNAETSLANTKAKAEADLESAYAAALTAAQKAVITGKTAVLTLTDIQYAHFTGNYQEEIVIADAKAIAVESLLGASNAGRWTTVAISGLSRGAYGGAQGLTSDSPQEAIDLVLVHTLGVLTDVKLALDTIPVSNVLTSTEKTNLATEKTNVTTEISTVSSKQQAVAVQRSLNQNNITAAQNTLLVSQNTLKAAQDEWRLKKAGSSAEAIAAGEARVKAAAGNLQNARAILEKTLIVSPTDGLVTRQEAKVGEIIAANAPVVSVIADAAFEIETFIPEADIVKVKPQDRSRVTLDAYSSEVFFEAVVSRIDPAETMVEGVATYKTILQFVNLDPRIRSGMTANLDIKTEERAGVLAIPERTVRSEGDKRLVKVLGATTVAEQEVQTGLRGSDGSIEITNGLLEGDKVIVAEPAE